MLLCWMAGFRVQGESGYKGLLLWGSPATSGLQPCVLCTFISSLLLYFHCCSMCVCRQRFLLKLWSLNQKSFILCTLSPVLLGPFMGHPRAVQNCGACDHVTCPYEHTNHVSACKQYICITIIFHVFSPICVGHTCSICCSTKYNKWRNNRMSQCACVEHDPPIVCIKACAYPHAGPQLSSSMSVLQWDQGLMVCLQRHSFSLIRLTCLTQQIL